MKVGVPIRDLATRNRTNPAEISRLQVGLRAVISRFRRKLPERLLIAPQDIRFADSGIAADIHAGQLTFAGRTVLCPGKSPFEAPSPAPAWTSTLEGFGWLRHFRDSDDRNFRLHARILVQQWLDTRALHPTTQTNEPGVIARRVLSWLSHSPMLLQDADHDFYQTFLKALAKDAARLERLAAHRNTGSSRVTAAIAFTNYCLCAQLGDNDWKFATRLLIRALEDDILHDGGHISRNPYMSIETATDLLPLRNAFAARSKPIPGAVQSALDRLMSFIQTMRHPSGEIALFNGMGATPLDLIAMLLSLDDGNKTGTGHAPESGYRRLEQGTTVLFVDIGGAPPAPFSREAHAGSTSFEMSCGRDRIVANCGACPAGHASMREALRETSAHSTLSTTLTSSSIFEHKGHGEPRTAPRLRDQSGWPGVEESTDTEFESLVLQHRGYDKAFALTHERRLDLARNGDLLRGQDRLLQGKTRKKRDAPSFYLRFHLHPRVKANLVRQATAVLIQTPSGDPWIFEAGGMAIALEESIFFGGLELQRRTQQIVLHLPTTESIATWSFRRYIDSPGRKLRQKKESEQTLL